MSQADVQPVTHAADPSAPPQRPRDGAWKLGLIVGLTAVMAVLVLRHIRHVNGPWYWTWSWRRLTFWLYPAMALAGAPFALGQVLWVRGRRRAALAALFASTLLLMLTAMALQPPTGLRRLPPIIYNAAITGYYTDATILSQQSNISTWELLYQYPDIVPTFHHHARYKPPGLMLYYLALIRLFGPGALAATVGGLGIALVGSAAPVATYAMLHRLSGGDEDAAFCGASYLALCPSLLFFWPMFDQVYVTLAAILLFHYAGTVLRPGWRSAVAFGAVMALALFLSYILLVLGAFFVIYWLVLLADRGFGPAYRAARALLLAASVCVSLYALLWLVTGFDAIATFRSISRIQADYLVSLARPFPQHLPYDVIDLILGSGYISILLVGFYLFDRGRGAILDRGPGDRLVQIGLLQILIVIAAALLPGEAARLSMLLLPLLMAPVGLELAKWSPRRRMVVYACLWLITVVICQNMTFVYLGPEFDGPR
jgi:hypothetical protein